MCNERCHIGKCPPCPRLVSIRCPCGKKEFTIRCNQQHLQLPENTCNLPCLKLLPCGIHRCKQRCHYGECPPCQSTITQTCFCGNEQRVVPCGKASSEHYSCNKVCDKPLSCGYHHCPLPCHEGPCPDCPNKPPRTCFCGKKGLFLSFQLSISF